TATGTLLVWEQQRAELVTAFSNDVDDFMGDLHDDIDRSLQLLDDVAIADQSITGFGRAGFRAYVEQVVPLHPELLGVSWVPRVADADRAAFERAEQTEFADFKITE